MLRRKITALESLASNPGTTAAESESAQSAANRMRLELARLVREAGSRPAAANGAWAAPGPERSVDTAAAREAAPAREAPEPQETTPTPTRPSRRSRISVRSAPAWTWQIPGLGIVAVIAVFFWMKQREEGPEPLAKSDVPSAAGAGAPVPLGSEAARERERNAILARIEKTGGSSAVAEAMRACRIRDLVKEFQATSGAVVRAGEESVDVRRRCGAYLTVRGFDDAICFPATVGNPHPVCPVPE